MAKATEDLLSDLHGAMASAMKEKLESGEVSASDLNVIRQFLKDNGVECDGNANENLKGLADDLPDSLDDNVHPLYGG